MKIKGKIKEMDISSECKEQETKRFLQEAILMVEAAQVISKNNILLTRQSLILYHFSIELLLKACDIWENSKLLFSHDLNELIPRIKFIKLNGKDKKQLNIINDYFEYRYPISQEIYEKMKITLDENAEEIIPNMKPLPCEISTDDLQKANRIYEQILSLMPAKLKEKHDEVIEILNSGRALV